MHKHYILCLCFMIYLSYLTECANLDEVKKSKDEPENKVTNNVPTDEKVELVFNKKEILSNQNDISSDIKEQLEQKQSRLQDKQKQNNLKDAQKQNNLKDTQKQKNLKENSKETQKESNLKDMQKKNNLHDMQKQNNIQDELKQIDLQAEQKQSILNENKLSVSSKDSLKQKEDGSSESSSHIYKPKYINKDNLKDKPVTSDEYLEVLKEVYLQELGLYNDIFINEVKKEAGKITPKDKKKFAGTAEETVVFQEMSEEEYEEMLKIDDLDIEELPYEIQDSLLDNEDIDPNPSFSDLNLKEIIHTSRREKPKPPGGSKSKASASETSEKGKKKKEPELTEEEKQAKVLYETAVMILNSTKPDRKRAYDLFKQAAALNHLEAGKVVGQAYFFGDVFPQNLTAAFYWFDKLSKEKGSPFAQMHLGLMYAAGLRVPSREINFYHKDIKRMII